MVSKPTRSWLQVFALVGLLVMLTGGFSGYTALQFANPNHVLEARCLVSPSPSNVDDRCVLSRRSSFGAAKASQNPSETNLSIHSDGMALKTGPQRSSSDSGRLLYRSHSLLVARLQQYQVIAQPQSALPSFQVDHRDAVQSRSHYSRPPPSLA